MRMSGGGGGGVVKKEQIFADVLYGWSQRKRMQERGEKKRREVEVNRKNGMGEDGARAREEK